MQGVRSVIYLCVTFGLCHGSLKHPDDPFRNEVHVSKKGLDCNFTSKEIDYAVLIGQVIANEDGLHDDQTFNTVDIEEAGSILFRGGPLPDDYITRSKASKVMLKTGEVLRKHFCSAQDPRSFMYNIEDAKLKFEGFYNSSKIDCRFLRPEQLKYRFIDGLCNNLKHSDWGRAETIYTRLLAASYADGVHRPRISVHGSELPSARVLSTDLFPKDVLEHETLNVAACIWAQVLSHDIGLQITDFGKNGPIKCCTSTNCATIPHDVGHRSCYPIEVPSDDKIYEPHGIRCMNFVRSITVPRPDNVLAPADQLNAMTSYLDCSFVYGSKEALTNSLRAFKDGLLLVDTHTGFLLPAPIRNFCDVRSDKDPCYRAGDVRVNQNLILAAFQNMFTRNHNAYALQLKDLNPHWTDEKIFQEARRINIAVYQHITYKEYLPYFFVLTDACISICESIPRLFDTFLRVSIDVVAFRETPLQIAYISSGVKRKEFEVSRHRRLEWSLAESDYVNGDPYSAMRRGGRPDDSFIDSLFREQDKFGYTYNYDDTINAGSINIFSIAFRVFHSTIPSFVKFYNEKREFLRNITFSDEMFRMTELGRANGYDDIIISMSTQPMYKFDERMTTQITNLMFKAKNPVGLDLSSFDIQRSRDHGIPSYNDVREACGSPRLRNFDELADEIGYEKSYNISKYYKNVDDIDFLVGALYEPKVEGTEFGPTVNVILREQFARLMMGDRFFYTNKNMNYPFSAAQLREIKKSSAAMLMCQNSDNLKSIQRHAFRLISKRNPLVSCEDIPIMNLKPWQERY